MLTESQETIGKRAAELTRLLEPLDSDLHQTRTARVKMSGREQRAARRMHATVCDGLTIARRIRTPVQSPASPTAAAPRGS